MNAELRGTALIFKETEWKQVNNSKKKKVKLQKAKNWKSFFQNNDLAYCPKYCFQNFAKVCFSFFVFSSFSTLLNFILLEACQHKPCPEGEKRKKVACDDYFCLPETNTRQKIRYTFLTSDISKLWSTQPKKPHIVKQWALVVKFKKRNELQTVVSDISA